jgi:hypothetical protein
MQKANCARAIDQVVMDCGGKRSATPLSLMASGLAWSIYADSSQSGLALRLPPQSISEAARYAPDFGTGPANGTRPHEP